MKMKLTLDSFAVILYCGDLIPTNQPSLTTEEWLEVEKKVRGSSSKDVSRIMSMNFDALTQIVGINEYLAYKILARNELLPHLFHALHNLENEGIDVITKYEEQYPSQLKSLKKRAPLILYFAGDLSIIGDNNLSVVGPQSTDKKLNFSTKNVVTKCYDESRTLVCTGIKGVDTYAMKLQLSLGGKVVCFVSDHMFEKNKTYSKQIKNQQLLLLSAVDPYAYFDVTNALDRNIYVCGLSEIQLVTASHINSGPVWFTAIQNLHYHWTKQLVLENPEYNGNIRLVEMGATALTNDDLLSLLSIQEIIDKNDIIEEKEQIIVDQMSIFEFIED